MPRAEDSAGADYGEAEFIAFCVFHRADAGEQLAADSVFHVADVRFFEWDTCAVGAHGFEAAGKQRREVVAALFLHIRGELAEQTDEHGAFVFLVRRGCGAALGLGCDGGGKISQCGFQRWFGDGRGLGRRDCRRDFPGRQAWFLQGCGLERW